MNKIGIYFAFWEKEWNADYAAYIRKVSRLGFDTLEVEAGALEKMPDSDKERIAAVAREEGIDLTYCIGLPPSCDVSSMDEETRKRGIKYVRKLLDTVHFMGGDMLGGIIYSCWPMKDSPSWEEKKARRAQAICSVKELSKTAEDYGIDYCLEIVNRFEQCILNTAQEGVDFLEEVGSGRVKLLLDSFHMNIEEDGFRDAILTADRNLGHFHIGECNRKVPGMGHMNWKEIASALKDVNYQGRIVMEPFMRPGGQVGKDIRIYRDLSGHAADEDLDRMASQALSFMRGILA